MQEGEWGGGGAPEASEEMQRPEASERKTSARRRAKEQERRWQSGEIRIDRSKTLAQEPGTGHNRWHPDIPPAIRCEPGDEVVLDTRDAFDGQMTPDASLETVAAPNLDVVHPLTGPVYVEGAEPGDLLEVEILDIEPDSYGYTRPGAGVRVPA